MKNLFKFVFAALTVAMLSTACGGAKEEATTEATEAAAPAEEVAPAAEEAAPADSAAAPAAEAAPAEAAH